MQDLQPTPRRMLNLRNLPPLQLVLTLTCLMSGLALVLTITLNLPLWLTLGFLGVVMLSGSAAVWQRSSPLLRAALKRRLWFGVRIGFLATLAYDGSRLLLVTLLSYHVSPFEALKLFGYSLLGSSAPLGAAWAAGIAYHELNGMLFASAFALLIGGRRWWLGVVWALVLEYLMFTLYSGWLNISAVMDEFTVMSLTGHIAYGLVLGIGCQRGLRSAVDERPAARGAR